MLDLSRAIPILWSVARQSPYWSALRYAGWEAEDIRQELALRLCEAQARTPYDAARGQAGDGYSASRSSVGAYCYGVAHRSMRDWYERSHATSRGGVGARRRRSMDGEPAPLPRRALPWEWAQGEASEQGQHDCSLSRLALVRWRGEAWCAVVVDELRAWVEGEHQAVDLSAEAEEVVRAWAMEHDIDERRIGEVLRGG